MNNPRETASFPTAAGVLLGLGLGGFFDGIVLHQLLQWHHMLSQWYPPNTLENLRINTVWDGIFHSVTYLLVVGGFCLLWRSGRDRPVRWRAKDLWGSVLIGFGSFNVLEGLIDHHLLQIHHVNELVAPEQRFAWDVGFMVWGAIMLVCGWWLKRFRRGSAATGRSDGSP